MLYCVDPPEQPAVYPVMSTDLRAALGAIQRGAEKQMEVLKQKKRQLEVGETKPQLVEHVEVDKEGELLKIEVETEESDDGMEGDGAWKQQVTQSIVSIRDAKQKENIVKQERWWFALAGKKSTSSASLGAPPEAMEMTTGMIAASSTGTEGAATSEVGSTTEGDTVDLEAVMLSQGDDNDDVYGQRYCTMPEDRTDRTAARAKQKENCEKQEKERVVMQYIEAQLQKEVKECQKQEEERALLEQEEKAVEERRRKSEEKQKA